MSRISTNIISHELRIDPSIRLISQNWRSFGPDKHLVIKKEVGRLLNTKFVRELRFQSWVTTPVLVKQLNG